VKDQQLPAEMEEVEEIEVTPDWGEGSDSELSVATRSVEFLTVDQTANEQSLFGVRSKPKVETRFSFFLSSSLFFSLCGRNEENGIVCSGEEKFPFTLIVRSCGVPIGSDVTNNANVLTGLFGNPSMRNTPLAVFVEDPEGDLRILDVDIEGSLLNTARSS
jgi:hypothetical protein